MADAIELASSLLTLIVFTFNASKSLSEAVSSFRNQRKATKDVLADLDSLITVLGAIRGQAQHSQEIGRLEPLREPLRCCATACREMREMLDAFITHSKEGQDNVGDWLKMRYHEKSFDDMKRRLASYKSTLTITFNLINIQDHSITQDSLRDLKGLITDTKKELKDQLDQVRQTISSDDTSLRQILQDDQARLQSSLDSIKCAQRILDTTQPKVTVEHNRAGQGSRAIFGTDTPQPLFSLTVSDNEAGLGAVMGSGVHSPQTLQTLLTNSRTPNLALALQALQTQSRTTNAEALLSVLKVFLSERKEGLTDIPSDTDLSTGQGASELLNTTRTVEPLGQSIGFGGKSVVRDSEALELYEE